MAFTSNPPDEPFRQAFRQTRPRVADPEQAAKEESTRRHVFLHSLAGRERSEQRAALDAEDFEAWRHLQSSMAAELKAADEQHAEQRRRIIARWQEKMGESGAVYQERRDALMERHQDEFDYPAEIHQMRRLHESSRVEAEFSRPAERAEEMRQWDAANPAPRPAAEAPVPLLSRLAVRR